MRFINIRTLSDPGNVVNEDHFSVSERHLLAVDGASGLYGHHLMKTDGSDAAWLARRCAEEYGRRLAESGAPMAKLCLETAEQLGEEFLSQAGSVDSRDAYPSAGLVALRLREGRLESYVLGDLTMLLRFRDGRVEVLHDGTLTALDDRVLREMARLAAESGESVAQQKPKVQKMLRDHRELRNREGGYMIFDPTGEGAARGLAGSCPAEEVDTVALLSDGIADAVSAYGMEPDYGAFLARLEKEGPAAVIAALRLLQKEDPGFDRYPRFKMGDDATVVLADLRG